MSRFQAVQGGNQRQRPLAVLAQLVYSFTRRDEDLRRKAILAAEGRTIAQVACLAYRDSKKMRTGKTN